MFDRVRMFQISFQTRNLLSPTNIWPFTKEKTSITSPFRAQQVMARTFLFFLCNMYDR